MKILFDQGTPAPLRQILVGHEISTAFEMNLAEVSNGELLRAAEAAFDLLITTDQHLHYQQNLAGMRLAVLVLPTTSWPKIRSHATEVVAAATSMRAGEFRTLKFLD